MAQAEIIVGSEADLPTLVRLHNEIYRPPADAAMFRRRFLGRYNVLMLLALVNREPAGFQVGFELKPGSYYSWLAGVLASQRRQGVARQLMEAQIAWARERGYDILRLEVGQSNRVGIMYALSCGFHVIGIRLDSTHSDQMLLLERMLDESLKSRE